MRPIVARLNPVVNEVLCHCCIDILLTPTVSSAYFFVTLFNINLSLKRYI